MIDLLLVIHCHQPVGNFDHVFQGAHDRCYRPLLDLFEAFSDVKAGVHFSGPLLEWIEKHEPDTLDLLSGLISQGRLEPLSGGFFEPLLSTIPLRDVVGQVQMMNHYIKDRFHYEPNGFWLTERVWDPGLPSALEGTGMQYTIVDDTHFFYAGLQPHEIYGHYLTEKEGRPLHLLATPMEMTYLIPFKPVGDVLGHLKTMHDAGHRVAVYGDDGEKFGQWPGTYEWVIEKGWLKDFFSAVTENRDWLRTLLPWEFISSTPPSGRIYLPMASYEEMTEWALPTLQGRQLNEMVSSLKTEGRWERWRPFVRGGIWDNFLVKYDESNRMHKKMLYLSERVSPNTEAQEYLWRAQCNCAYWHGVFGGLYLGHLRRAIYENLIRAQACQSGNTRRGVQLMRLDVDRDGFDEILIQAPHVSLGFEPHKGGGLFEISLLSHALNLCDTLTRRQELYHDHFNDTVGSVNHGNDEGIASIHDIIDAGQQDLKHLLIFDSYTRASLLDHFLGKETRVEDYAENSYSELGDFIKGSYNVEEASSAQGRALVKLSRTGAVNSSTITITKTVQLEDKPRLWIDHELACHGPGVLSTLYGCEYNLTLYSDTDPERYYAFPERGARREITETGVEDNIRQFELFNGPDRLRTVFRFPRPVTIWFYPLMSVSKSEKGFDRTYQGSSILFVLPLELKPGEKAGFKTELEFIDL
ncbi:MAG: alpha-amylase/4-alpha-glucanotransferase domain-containing protein [Desulfatiglans sp.]|jgi:alpha-amylase|nr:alpha-amylase/4-alpha-glucanotransferase domain-containing protein [Desulfatiglans sp.]